MTGVVKRFFVFCIRFVAGVFRWNQPRACRFHPSCSRYAEQAFEKFGIAEALWLTLSRVCRCHPFAEGGYDPLPEARIAK